jgi:hypothetical protein
MHEHTALLLEKPLVMCKYPCFSSPCVQRSSMQLVGMLIPAAPATTLPPALSSNDLQEGVFFPTARAALSFAAFQCCSSLLLLPCHLLYLCMCR